MMVSCARYAQNGTQIAQPQLLPRKINSENERHATAAGSPTTKSSLFEVPFIDLHLVVPGAMSVDASHAICDRIENALREAVHGAVVTIHVEPDGKAKHRGIPVLSPSSRHG